MEHDFGLFLLFVAHLSFSDIVNGEVYLVNFTYGSGTLAYLDQHRIKAVETFFALHLVFKTLCSDCSFVNLVVAD